MRRGTVPVRFSRETVPPISRPGLLRMSIAATDLRRGMAIIFQGEPCRVVEFHHHTPGNLRAMVQAKPRKLKSGMMTEHRFRASDTVDVADLETHELESLYRAGDLYRS